MPQPRSSVNAVFCTFVCAALSVLLGMHLYSHWRPPEAALDSGFSDVVMQLSKGLYEVTQKHDTLQQQLERLSAALPAVAAAAGRARDALQPSLKRASRSALDLVDFDRQVTDYALESAGARVIDTGDSVEHVVLESPLGWALHVLATALCRDCHAARAMLRPGALPGECWAVRGARADATVLLIGSVVITGLSLEHIPPNISPTREISSAPRQFTLEGLEYKGDPHPHEYGKFEYDYHGSAIQYFEVQRPTSKPYHMVRFRVLSNWGHSVFTCVYRLRVHGDLAPGQAPDDDLRIDNE